LLGALLLLNTFSWLYGLTAFKFHWTSDYNTVKSFSGAFLTALAYNLILLYPTFIYYDFTKRIIDGFSVRKRA